MDKAAKIRELNDAFRKTLIGGRVLLTAGVDALDANERAAVIRKVSDSTAFEPGNDPYGEHDFVTVEHNGERYFGKIDYYSSDLCHGSDDPADPGKTVRVLTIMRADEY